MKATGGAFAEIRAAIERGLLAELSPPEWKVLSVLIFAHRNREGIARPGLQLLGTETGMGRTQLKAALRALRGRGVIVEVQRGRSARTRGTQGTASVFEIPFPIEGRKTDLESTCLRAGKSTVGKPPRTGSENRPPTILWGPVMDGASTKQVVGGRKTVPHTEQADLTDDHRLAVLFDKYRTAGLVNDCEADRHDFNARAANCVRSGRNAPALFAEGFRRGNWRTFITVQDEEISRCRRNGRILTEARA